VEKSGVRHGYFSTQWNNGSSRICVGGGQAQATVLFNADGTETCFAPAWETDTWGGMKQKKTLLDEYRFPGCRPRARLKGVFGDPLAQVVALVRTQKKSLWPMRDSRPRLL